MSWEVKRDPGVTVIPPKHSILLCWERPRDGGKRGSKYEVTVVLPAPTAKQMLCSSGKVVGLEYRLFMSKTIDVDDLKANMVWVKLPPSNKRSISEQWRRLCNQPWFAGLMAGDKDDRLGVRV